MIGHKINTNRLYIVSVYRVIENKIDSVAITTTANFSRNTVVYEKDYGDYYDLLTEKILVQICIAIQLVLKLLM